MTLGLARTVAGVALYDPSSERVALVDGGDADWVTLIASSAGGPRPMPRAVEWRSIEEIPLLPPVEPVARVVCVAQNYRSHAQEASGTEPPATPVIFLKPYSALVAHGDPTRMPGASSFFDYETELGVVIGREVSGVDEQQASSAIAGYTLANDATARDLQPVEFGGRTIVDWFSAKSLDRSSALGPAVISRDAVDWRELRIRCALNGEVVQDERAGAMIHTPERLIAHVSRVMRLQPGDVILTGTPAGVGKARGRPLEVGDRLTFDLGSALSLRTWVAG